MEILVEQQPCTTVSANLKYAYPSTVNAANFVTVKPYLEGGKGKNFKNWKEQMVCLLESQDVLSFVDGRDLPPEKQEETYYKAWRRTDRLVKGWILGSVGTDVVDALRDKETARDAWLEIHNMFNPKKQEPDNNGSGNNVSRYLAVYQAALRGDWDAAKNLFEHDINEMSTAVISRNSETALHIAVLTGKPNNDLVKKLVEVMPREALAIKDCYGQTALHNAAKVGNTAAAYALVNKNPDLLHISSDTNRLPVRQAAISCQKETLKYLISEHEKHADRTPFQGQLGVSLLNATITSEYVDIALDLAEKYPDLALLRRDFNGSFALTEVAAKTSLFAKTETFTWYQKLIYHRIPVKKTKSEIVRTSDNENQSNGAAPNNYSTSFQILCAVGQKVESMIWHSFQTLVPNVQGMMAKKSRHRQAIRLAEYLCDQIISKLPEKEASVILERSIITAAEHGISEIVEMIINKYPDVTFYSDAKTGMNIFQLAASYRFENVINLLYNFTGRKYMFFYSTDKDDNNLLHICGKLAPPDRLNLVAGATLQMQRELQWFKEMENFVHPSRRTWLNKNLQTPQMVFTKEHEKLKAEGERWMKDTASACTIAAGLIATVMFAAVFTVPGGVESASGVPLFTGRRAFELFAVSDAISLFSSITSLLMFVSILTSRYAEQDFLYSLPRRLSIGLFGLFVSILFMLVAFNATFYLVLERDIAWFIVLTTFTCLPVTSFVLLQFPLLLDVVYSTYGPGIFGKKSDRLLY